MWMLLEKKKHRSANYVLYKTIQKKNRTGHGSNTYTYILKILLCDNSYKQQYSHYRTWQQAALLSLMYYYDMFMMYFNTSR